MVHCSIHFLIHPQHLHPSFIFQTHVEKLQLRLKPGFPGGAVVENPPANAGDTGSSPGLGGSHMPRSN